MNQIELGKFINKLRVEANLTQDELAEKVGVSSGKIVSKWENGYSLPDIFILKKLSIVLDVTLYELTECKRFKKKSMIDATKSFIKSSKDVFKLNIIGKVTIVIAILLGIFFSLCTIYTIDNYNEDIIYNIESMDENFVVRGKIIFTKTYNSFDLLEIFCVDKEKKDYNIKVNNIEYNIINKDKNNKILTYANRFVIDYTNRSDNLLDNMNHTRFSIILDDDTKNEIKSYKDDTLFLQISYENNDRELNKIKIPLKIVKKYQNNL